MKQSSKENLAKVEFEPMNYRLSPVQFEVLPSELSSPMMGLIPVHQYLCYYYIAYRP